MQITHILVGQESLTYLETTSITKNSENPKGNQQLLSTHGQANTGPNTLAKHSNSLYILAQY